MTATAAINDLPDDAQAVLADAPAVTRSKSGTEGADRFQYELTIPAASGRRTRTYRFAESAVPESLQPLVNHLTAKLVPGR